MEHILLQCSAPSQRTIWKLCQELWEKKHKKMPKLTYGTIFGCSLADSERT
ncbi:hypothetical protein DFH09DRAFT_15893 [Mycena vulgaris]|nr:hypothetical protein DFH09DRAFT_15893 [Mycena vulgaris]